MVHRTDRVARAEMEKMEKVIIPKFSSEAQEAEWWDTHRSEIEAEVRRRMKQMELEVTKVSLAPQNLEAIMG